MKRNFLKCAVMLPTAVFSTLPNATFSKNSENLKTLLKNKYFVPILATSILGISLLLIRKNFFNFVTFEGSKSKDKKIVNNSKDEQMQKTIISKNKEHKIPNKDADPDTGSDINSSQDVRLGKDGTRQKENVVSSMGNKQIKRDTKDQNEKQKIINEEISVSRDKFCTLEIIYKKINFLKILVIFSIWYIFRLVVKGVFFMETIFDFEAWATEESSTDSDIVKKVRKEEKEKKYKNLITYNKQSTGSTFYLKKNSNNNKDYVILFFDGRGAPPKESACTETSKYDVATVMHRYVAKENDSIFKKIYNLFMVSESSIYKDAEDLYDYVTDTLGYKNVIVKAFSLGGAVGAHVVKYAEEKAKKEKEKQNKTGVQNKLERLFIVSSIGGIYTSAKQFIYASLRLLNFTESFCNFLKYVGAIIAKISLFDYSLDSFDSLKKLENKEFPVHVFSGEEQDFLNDDVTKLSGRLKNAGMKNISYTQKVSNLSHVSSICKIDRELYILNNLNKI